MRRTRLTTSCEVRPAGLSITKTPFIAVLCYRGRGWHPRSTRAVGSFRRQKGKVWHPAPARTMIPIRDDQPRFSTPYVTYFMVALNTAVFLFELWVGFQSQRALNGFLYEFGVVPKHVTGALGGSPDLSLTAAFLPILTSMFLHGSWLPAWIVLGYWFLVQFLAGTTSIGYSSQTSGGVAFWAHVGGFVAGIVLIKVFPERPRRYRYGTW